MSEKQINLAYFMERSTVNGPGTRAVVWVQGCHHKCNGCFNPQNWSFKTKTEVPVSELANRILMIDGIDGVTFSGGEPFNQAEALSELAGILQENGLTVLIFTGYTYAELKNKNRPNWNRLISNADLLVSGRYVQEKAVNGVSLIGSSNQQIISLTGKISQPDNDISPVIEIVITPSVTYLTGFPSRDQIEQFKAMVR